MAKQPDFNSDKYKSLGLAYEFVVPSHDWAIRRLEAAERRIDNLMRFIITVTLALGASVIAVAELSDEPTWLQLNGPGFLTISSFLIAVALGMYVID